MVLNFCIAVHGNGFCITNHDKISEAAVQTCQTENRLQKYLSLLFRRDLHLFEKIK